MNARKLLSAAKAVEAAYIEDVFSTYLYTGNGSTQTITNGIDLSGKGGLVWIKCRSDAGTSNNLFDTLRGATKRIYSNLTNAESTGTDTLTAFTSSGFSVSNNGDTNESPRTYASWTFRKQAKFFDVVTYTANGTSPRSISHNLGVTPGCVIVKSTSASGDWFVWHRYNSAKNLKLNSTAAEIDNNFITAVSATTFTVASDANFGSDSYVAYLFAHDAGGFGASGSDNVISCGSYTGNGVTGLAVTLGYEPQWVMVKCSSAAQADGWIMVDNMRGMDNSANAWLKANTSGAETAESPRIVPTATGFTLSSNAAVNTNAATYIYIAIRRGPMKTPTTGTSVYYANKTPSTNIGNVGFPVDLGIMKAPGVVQSWLWGDRLRGWNPSTNTGYVLYSDTTGAENSQFGGSGPSKFDVQNGFGTDLTYTSYDFWNFRRAPGFFDEVCYTGTGANRTVTHNLGVVPELMIIKRRSSISNWLVYDAINGNQAYLLLNWNDAVTTSSPTVWNSTSPTSSVFSLGTNATGNANGETYVAYLFATCPGVSKVGSYTGTGSTLQIDCGFTGGARFVLIKRTDSTGDWYVWDSARGIVAGNDPYLLLNSTAAEVTTTDWVDTYSAGFELSSAVGNNANINTATYIFLAIA